MIYLLIVSFLIYIAYYNQSNYLNFILTFCLVMGIVSILYTIIVALFIRLDVKAEAVPCYKGGSKRIIIKNNLFFSPALNIKTTVYNKHFSKKIGHYSYRVDSSDLACSIPANECGDIEVRVDSFVIKSPFELFKMTRHTKYRPVYRVYPSPSSFKDEEVKKITIKGEGEPVNLPGGDYQEIYEIRPIQEGDNLRYIHPALSAKYDQYMIKVGSESQRKIATYEIEEQKSFIDVIPQLEKVYAIYNEYSKTLEYQFFVKYKFDYYNICDNTSLISLFDLVYEGYLKK